ncbi:MAG: hypothetical protein HY815_20675 [Candidatus Riflebacteria bacterium]|nr:hypothetical protein [Candidatus Riflebacteria bacterium]
MNTASNQLQKTIDQAVPSKLTGLSRDQVAGLNAKVQAESVKNGFTYERDAGRPEPITLHPLPVVVGPDEAAKLRDLALELRKILMRVLPHARKHPQLTQLLPLDPEEESFLGRVYSKQLDEDPPLAYRLDADIDFTDPGWYDKVKLFGLNGSAVAGYYYSSAANDLMADLVARETGLELPRFDRLGMPEVLLAMLQAQAARVGRKAQNFAYIQDRSWNTGITEGPSFQEWFKKRGVNLVVIDPRELSLKESEIYAGDVMIDIVYRNMEIRDLVSIEREHGHLRALEQAFARNQVVSSLWGDFDHKSLWELLDTPEATRRLTAAQRAFLRNHIPWTRTLRHTFTRTSDGERVDLLEHVRKNRESLVIKPNRACQGQSVCLGPRVTQSDWEKHLSTATSQSGHWVVQSFVKATTKGFPLIMDGTYGMEAIPTTYGFVATPERFGCLGRASRNPVVNVSLGGGVFPVLLVDQG